MSTDVDDFRLEISRRPHKQCRERGPARIALFRLIDIIVS